MREGLDLFHGIAAELVADHLQLFVQPGATMRDFGLALFHQLHQAGAGAGVVAVLHEMLDRFGQHRAALVLAQAHVRQAHDFALVHLDAAVDLRQVLAKGDLVDQLLDLAKGAFRLQTGGPGLHLTQRFDVGGQPGQPVCGKLVLLDQGAGHAAIGHHHSLHMGAGGFQDALDRRDRFAGQGQKVGQNHAAKAQVLSVMRHSTGPLSLSPCGLAWPSLCANSKICAPGFWVGIQLPDGPSYFAGAAQQKCLRCGGIVQLLRDVESTCGQGRTC